MEIEKIVLDMPKSSNLRFAFKILISHIKHYYQTQIHVCDLFVWSWSIMELC